MNDNLHETFSWVNIWANRDTLKAKDQNVTVQDLLRLNGFDENFSRISGQQWKSYVCHVLNNLNVIKTTTEHKFSLHEIGCGSGAFLLSARHVLEANRVPHVLSGGDVSAKLVDVALKMLPDAEINVQEAIEYKNTGKDVTCVVSHSVFQYFSSYDYAVQVLEGMLVHSKSSFAVLDVPMLHLREASEERRKQLAGEEYDKKYSGGLKHLYYPVEMFTDFAAKHCLRIKIETDKFVMLPGYENAKYRYDIFFVKTF